MSLISDQGIGGFYSAVWEGNPYESQIEKAIKIAYDWHSDEYMMADAIGHEGTDFIYANSIANTLDGQGGDDIVIYEGKISDYEIVDSGDGDYTVTRIDTTDIDALNNIEDIFFIGDEQWF